MWSEVSADARVYRALRWQGSEGAWGRILIWVRSPGLLVLAFQRLNHSYLVSRQRDGWTAKTIALRFVLALALRPIMLMTKSDLAASIAIGAGVYVSDRGYLVLGAQRIGGGTLIHERVTIGARAGEEARPRIGKNVWIGPDCVIYGNIVVGDGATILPGSVVSMAVPAGAVAGGNPATIVRRDFDNSSLRRTLLSDVDLKSLAVQ